MDFETMAGICCVDAELFDSLLAAIDFVARHGGGIVYSEMAGTQYAKSFTLPDNVRLEASRPLIASLQCSGQIATAGG